MSVDDMREVIKQVSRAQSSFLLNILDKSNVGNGQPAPEPQHPDQCSYCREMPTQQETVLQETVPELPFKVTGTFTAIYFGKKGNYVLFFILNKAV